MQSVYCNKSRGIKNTEQEHHQEAISIFLADKSDETELKIKSCLML